MAISFEHLRDFIRTLMRMAPIYQPVMIRSCHAFTDPHETSGLRDIDYLEHAAPLSVAKRYRPVQLTEG